MGHFLYRINIFPSPSLSSSRFSLNSVLPTCTTVAQLLQLGLPSGKTDKEKQNRDSLHTLWPEGVPSTQSSGLKDVFFTGFLLEFWLLTPPAKLALLRAYREMRKKEKNKQRSGDLPPYPLDHRALFLAFWPERKDFSRYPYELLFQVLTFFLNISGFIYFSESLDSCFCILSRVFGCQLQDNRI